jgi:hypothetical protein
MAGYHEQAVLDTNCHRILSSSSSVTLDDNMKQRDPPVIDKNHILQLLLTCLHNNSIDFWAKTELQHHFRVALTIVEALRSGLIRYIFDGKSVLHRGADCETVAGSESRPHLMGIYIIDSTVQWVQKGVLSVDEFSRICDALDISSRAKQKVRSLTTKLIDRRRRLIDKWDAANLPLADLLPSLGCQSTSKALISICDAHGIEGRQRF